jgi:hypothetical protein
MIESHSYAEPSGADSQRFADSEIPEPIDHWSLEDFADILPAEFY